MIDTTFVGLSAALDVSLPYIVAPSPSQSSLRKLTNGNTLGITVKLMLMVGPRRGSTLLANQDDRLAAEVAKIIAGGTYGVRETRELRIKLVPS